MAHEYEHPRPALTADVVCVRTAGSSREVLLIRRGREPFAGSWALPGGFVDEWEIPEDAARRELAEETGLVWTGDLDRIGVYGAPGRDPRGWTVSVAYMAVAAGHVDVTAADDAAEARWFAIDALPSLAFDHDAIVADALRTL